MLQQPYQDINDHIRQYRPMVKRIAGQIASRLPAHVMLDDLIQEGMTGLLDALHKYQAQEHASFEAYASMRIRGAIYDACRRDDVLPRHQREKLDQIERVTRALEQKLHRPPTEMEISQEVGMDLGAYQSMLESWINVLPIDEITENALPSSSADALLETVAQKQLLQKIAGWMPRLPEKQQLVLALHYQEDLSYREIAAVMDLTPGRISQLHTQAMIQIRAWLRAD